MITTDEIKTMILAAIADASVIVNGDDGVHFDAIVIAEQFSTLNQVKRQQLVYNALQDVIRSGQLHALALKTYTPHEWQLKGNQV